MDLGLKKPYGILDHPIGKDLGHFWLGYIRMLGHLQMSAHLVNFDRLRNCFHLSNSLGESKVLCSFLTCCKCHMDIGTMPIESVPHPLALLNKRGKI